MNMNKNKQILIYFAIICAGIGVFSDSVLIPLVTSIFAEFPNSSVFLANFIISGPSIIAIPAALIVGKLAHYISKKDLLIAGFIFYLIGGLGGIVANSMEFLAVTRAFSGVATGIIGVIALAFIPELYSEMKERSKVIGWYNAAACLFGVGMAFFAGLIAVVSWRNAFFINAFAVISLLLIIFFLPRTAPERDIEKKELAEGEKHTYPLMKVIFLLGGFFIIGVFYMILYYLVDIYIIEKALGTSTLSGTFSALGTLASFLGSLIFGSYYNKLKRMMPVTFFLGCSVAFLTLALSSNIIMIAIAFMLGGASYGLCLCYYAMVISEIVPESEMSLSMSFFMVIGNGAAFISPYIPMIIQRIFGVETYYGSFLYVGIFLMIGTVISLFLALRHKKNQTSCC